LEQNLFRLHPDGQRFFGQLLNLGRMAGEGVVVQSLTNLVFAAHGEWSPNPGLTDFRV
jgi:hypothetical protein